MFKGPAGLAEDSTNNIYVSDIDANNIRKLSSLGLVSTYAGTGIAGNTNGEATSAKFNEPIGLALDAAGNLYVADAQNNQIKRISAP